VRSTLPIDWKTVPSTSVAKWSVSNARGPFYWRSHCGGQRAPAGRYSTVLARKGQRRKSVKSIANAFAYQLNERARKSPRETPSQSPFSSFDDKVKTPRIFGREYIGLFALFAEYRAIQSFMTTFFGRWRTRGTPVSRPLPRSLWQRPALALCDTSLIESGHGHLDQVPESSHLRCVVKVFLLADLKLSKVDDLPQRAFENMPCRSVSNNGG
jgi:hypothetical protein